MGGEGLWVGDEGSEGGNGYNQMFYGDGKDKRVQMTSKERKRAHDRTLFEILCKCAPFPANICARVCCDH